MLANANAVSWPHLELDMQPQQLITTKENIEKRSGKQDSDTQLVSMC